MRVYSQYNNLTTYEKEEMLGTLKLVIAVLIFAICYLIFLGCLKIWLIADLDEIVESWFKTRRKIVTKMIEEKVEKIEK